MELGSEHITVTIRRSGTQIGKLSILNTTIIRITPSKSKKDY